MSTLKKWKNRDLNVYVRNQTFYEDGQPVNEFSKFGNRVDRIIHTLELVIEHQNRVKDGIEVPHTVDTRKGIVGFDIRDIIKSHRKFRSRVERISSPDKGWVDLLPALGILTILGNNFGDVLCPSDPDACCSAWRSVPKDQNYLAASVSTLALLLEHLQQSSPELGIGEFTSELSWRSPCKPFESCQCIKGKHVEGSAHHDPGQYIVSSSRWHQIRLKEAKPCDVSLLEGTGAVVFANITSLGSRPKAHNVEATANAPQEPSAGLVTNGNHQSSPDPASQSTTDQSLGSTDPTETSLQVAGPALNSGDESLPVSASQPASAQSSRSMKPTQASIRNAGSTSSGDQTRTHKDQGTFARLREKCKGKWTRITFDLARKRANT
ncbi:hypothetical protein J4E86_007395 [Alternaria arbusti]|uniref:uncharacterized protein n=1 Tax=Alternaria arbusti TaxID=232088 RepID=UPI00221EFF91|nr:uncharacterized protein J4E86_007395 [Alternaria arbusti]KAI4950887.1 hypothetical protein J4E86_007395 [Alternaria arbusti]